MYTENQRGSQENDTEGRVVWLFSCWAGSAKEEKEEKYMLHHQNLTDFYFTGFSSNIDWLIF